MSDLLTNLGNAPVTHDEPSGSTPAQRLAQLLDWEREFLAAQPKPEEMDQKKDSNLKDRGEHLTTSSTNRPEKSTEVEKSTTIFSLQPADLKNETQATSSSLTPQIQPTRPIASPNSLRANAAPLATKHASAARTPQTGEVVQSRNSMAAPGEFEEIMTRVVNKDGEIHVLMRDGNLRGDAGSRLANTIRKIIRQLGARLATFTLNGKTLVDENRNRPASKSDAPGSHERELDIFY